MTFPREEGQMAEAGDDNRPDDVRPVAPGGESEEYLNGYRAGTRDVFLHLQGIAETDGQKALVDRIKILLDQVETTGRLIPAQ